MARRPSPVPGTGRTDRRATGDHAETLAADYLVERGWTILARNVRVGRSEIDIVAREPDGTVVFVEVRSRTASRLGAPEESVDAAKVNRLYTAAGMLLRSGRSPDGGPIGPGPFRVDLVTLMRDQDGVWRLRGHLRGLTPP